MGGLQRTSSFAPVASTASLLSACEAQIFKAAQGFIFPTSSSHTHHHNGNGGGGAASIGSSLVTSSSGSAASTRKAFAKFFHTVGVGVSVCVGGGKVGGLLVSQCMCAYFVWVGSRARAIGHDIYTMVVAGRF